MKCVFVLCFVFGIFNDQFGLCGTVLTGRACEGENGKTFCCTDFFESNNGTCIECEEGFTTTFGTYPCKECPYPSYGRRCTIQCLCTSTQRCDHVIGCVNNTDPKSSAFGETTQATDSAFGETTQATDSAFGETTQATDNTTEHNHKKTPVMIILYSSGGTTVVLTLIVLIAAGIIYKLRRKNTKEPDEQLDDSIVENNVPFQISYKSNADIGLDLPPTDISLRSYKNNGDIDLDLPPHDISLLSIPLNMSEEKEYDYVDNDDGYLHPYDGLKIHDVKGHLYNELRKQSMKQ